MEKEVVMCTQGVNESLCVCVCVQSSCMRAYVQFRAYMRLFLYEYSKELVSVCVQYRACACVRTRLHYRACMSMFVYECSTQRAQS